MDQLLLANQSPVSFSMSVVNDIFGQDTQSLSEDSSVPFHLHSLALQQTFLFSALRILYNAEVFLECADGTWLDLFF